MNTLPDKVDQFMKCQMLHDRKQNEERSKMTAAERAATPKVDYLKPCIADADAGFGGITSVMKLTKLMIEAGAAGMHLEDQKPGVKKCGHLGGKVLVSSREHIIRLQSARLQSDIMGCDINIVARTDSLDASFIDNNIDPIDHPFIMGCVDPLNTEKTMTFVDAGKDSIKKNLSGT
jgi:isocitrate lyase